LPRLCEHLLGEPLALDSVPTWWCGEPAGRAYVLARLARLVVKSIAREGTGETLLGWELSTPQRDELRRRIEARPHQWVGQPRLDLSTVPTLSGEALVPRRAVLRAFLVAQHDSYVAMPGGLARVATNAGNAFMANYAGALSKDVWVLASEPEEL